MNYELRENKTSMIFDIYVRALLEGDFVLRTNTRLHDKLSSSVYVMRKCSRIYLLDSHISHFESERFTSEIQCTIAHGQTPKSNRNNCVSLAAGLVRISPLMTAHSPHAVD